MTGPKTGDRVRVTDIIERFGTCIELVTMDPNFHEISVGLYAKDGIFTVWSFSTRDGVKERLSEIRDQLVQLGGLEPVEGVTNQARFSCGQTHGRPLKFLTTKAVEKPFGHRLSEGRVKDLRSPLMLGFDSNESEGRWIYTVTAEGDAPNPAARLRAVTGGFTRYGGMEAVGYGVSFPCGYRHDKLVMIVLPYARNVNQVEDMLEADALRSQMTTGTLGFAPPS